MTLIQAIILGLVQGLTEFAPVSGSAHLVIVPWLLRWIIPDDFAFNFDVFVLLGTLLAVLLYFRTEWVAVMQGGFALLLTRDTASENSRMFIWICIGTAPAAVAGVLFKKQIEGLFQNPLAIAVFLIATAASLMFGEWVRSKNRTLVQQNWVDTAVIGLTQMVALLPGISRSGAAISAGLVRNIERGISARFSFLLSGPFVLGTGLLSLNDLISSGLYASSMTLMIAGFLSALVSGYAVIHWLLRFL